MNFIIEKAPGLVTSWYVTAGQNFMFDLSILKKSNWCQNKRAATRMQMNYREFLIRSERSWKRAYVT